MSGLAKSAAAPQIDPATQFANDLSKIEATVGAQLSKLDTRITELREKFNSDPRLLPSDEYREVLTAKDKLETERYKLIDKAYREYQRNSLNAAINALSPSAKTVFEAYRLEAHIKSFPASYDITYAQQRTMGRHSPHNHRGSW